MCKRQPLLLQLYLNVLPLYIMNELEQAWSTYFSTLKSAHIHVDSNLKLAQHEKSVTTIYHQADTTINT